MMQASLVVTRSVHFVIAGQLSDITSNIDRLNRLTSDLGSELDMRRSYSTISLQRLTDKPPDYKTGLEGKKNQSR